MNDSTNLLQLLLLARGNVDLRTILREARRHHLADTRATSGYEDWDS